MSGNEEMNISKAVLVYSALLLQSMFGSCKTECKIYFMSGKSLFSILFVRKCHIGTWAPERTVWTGFGHMYAAYVMIELCQEYLKKHCCRALNRYLTWE